MDRIKAHIYTIILLIMILSVFGLLCLFPVTISLIVLSIAVYVLYLIIYSIIFANIKDY